MQLKINNGGGFEILDTDTGDKFEFAGNLAKLKEALDSGSLGQGQIERIELAGGEITVDELFVTGEVNNG